jgi:cellulose synthase/poly-beta-1,6-N-acetylglucosamine synthase-like glycosyltransferase
MQEALQSALQWVNTLVISYYALISAVYTILLVLSVITAARHLRNFKNMHDLLGINIDRAPPITVLMPVYNEQAKIVQTVRSLLTLHYPNFEVLVINDGSGDETLKRLKEAFNLQLVPQIYRSIVNTTQPALSFYKNPQMPVLTVIDKRHSGKADSLNVGINVAQSPYFCSVDVDTHLKKDALLSLIRPILQTPNRVVACGGIVDIMGVQEADHVQLTERDLPSHIALRLQVITYLKRCLFGRMAWGHLNSFIGMSGECVLFQRRLVQRIGGYDLFNVLPNMELLLRLHRALEDQYQRSHILFTPELVGWRMLPERSSKLVEDEIQRQRGIIRTLLKFKGMAFRPRYGKLGLATLPLLLTIEVLGPFFETFGYITIAVSMGFGWIAMPAVLFFLFLAVVYSSFLSVSSVAAEAILYQGYRIRVSIQLALYAVVENLGYRQLIDWCRLWAVVR